MSEQTKETEQSSFIHVDDVHKSFLMGKEAVQALRGVSLDVARGEMICLMGPSGSGKTTLLNIIGGLEEPSRGHVIVDGENVVALSEDRLSDLRLHKMGFVFQSYNLLANLAGSTAEASLLARTPEDDLGQVTMREGAYNLEGGRLGRLDGVIITRGMADAFGLAAGDEIGLSYLLPVSRLPGHDLPQNGSVGQVARRFTISGIAQTSGLGGGERNVILASVATVQDWLNAPGQAERLVVVLDETVYSSMDTQASVFRVRRVAEEMQDALSAALGNDRAGSYVFSITKAQALIGSSGAFAFQRAFAGEGYRDLEGTVEAIVPQGETAAANAHFTVHVRLPPTDLRLLPGLTGRVEIFVGE